MSRPRDFRAAPFVPFSSLETDGRASHGAGRIAQRIALSWRLVSDSRAGLLDKIAQGRAIGREPAARATGRGL